MTLLFAESFDTDDAQADLIWGKWSFWTTTNGNCPRLYTTIGRNGTGALRFYNVDGYDRGVVGKYLGGEKDTIIFGSAYKYAELDSQESFDGFYNMGFKFTNGRTTTHVALNFIKDSKSIRARVNGVNGTLLGESDPNVLPANTWLYIEGKIYFHDTAGTIEVRINGYPVLELTNVDTRNGTTLPDTFNIGGVAYNIGIGGGKQDFDDIYVCDDQGTIANDFLGDVVVEVLRPNGAGATTGWTPSTGNNWECVNDTYIDTADYVGSTASGIYDTYSFSNLATISGAVYGIQPTAWVWKTSAGFKKNRFVYRPVSTDYGGSVLQYLLDSGKYTTEISELNPETSSQWTISEVNATEFGIKSEE